MEKQEMRACRRELINYHLQNYYFQQISKSCQSGIFFLRDVKFLVRNGEVYRYGYELQAYK